MMVSGCGSQTLWLRRDFMRSNSWTPSLLYYCPWRWSSRSFLTRPKALIFLVCSFDPPSLCLFGLQEEEVLSCGFLSLRAPTRGTAWPRDGTRGAFIAIQIRGSFSARRKLGHRNLNLRLSHAFQKTRARLQKYPEKKKTCSECGRMEKHTDVAVSSGCSKCCESVLCNFIRRLLCITEASVVLFTFVWQLKLQAAILFMCFLALLIGEVTGEGPQVRLGLRATVLLLWSLCYKPFLSSERMRICWRAQKNFAVQVAQFTFQTQIYNTQNTHKTPSTLLTLSP